MTKKRWLLGLMLITTLSILLSTSLGSVDIPLSAIFNTLFHPSDSFHSTIIWKIRLPRIYNAFIVGSLLALSGTLLQVMLKNPLAEPYILGVSGGASVGALIAIILGLGGLALAAWAFAGALLSMLLVFGIVLSGKQRTPVHILLTGVVVASGWGALVNLLLVIDPGEQVKPMLFWLMGDLSQPQTLLPGLITLCIGFIVSFIFSGTLNVMLQGDLTAKSLGVNIVQAQIVMYLLASLLTAIAVTMAGSIGFIGLVAPHMMRLLVGTDHRYLIPAATLFGGCLLVLSDTLARTIVAPQQLPPGVITAFLGVPMFLYLLTQSRRM